MKLRAVFSFGLSTRLLGKASSQCSSSPIPSQPCSAEAVHCRNTGPITDHQSTPPAENTDEGTGA